MPWIHSAFKKGLSFQTAISSGRFDSLSFYSEIESVQAPEHEISEKISSRDLIPERKCRQMII